MFSWKRLFFSNFASSKLRPHSIKNIKTQGGGFFDEIQQVKEGVK